MTTGPEPSTWQDPNPDAGKRDNSRTVLGATAAALSMVVVSALAVTLLVTGGSTASTNDIALQSAESIGPGPFTPSVTLASRPLSDLSSEELLAQLAGSLTTNSNGGSTVVGTTPGLYGGTNNDATCDAAALANYLSEDRAKSEAWASAFGITTDAIPFYLDTLTPVSLTTDLRVTNYSFSDGRATPFQSVLQAGTAVMIDTAGVPRIRCNCGNPLGPPASEPLSGYQPTGERWPSYREQNVVAVEYATRPAAGEPVPSTPNNATVDQFTLLDLDTLKPLLRSVGQTIDTSLLQRPETPLPDPQSMNLPLVPVSSSIVDRSTQATTDWSRPEPGSEKPTPSAAVTSRSSLPVQPIPASSTPSITKPVQIESTGATTTSGVPDVAPVSSPAPVAVAPPTASTTAPTTTAARPAERTTFTGESSTTISEFVLADSVRCTVVGTEAEAAQQKSIVKCSDKTEHVVSTSDLTAEKVSEDTKDGVWLIRFESSLVAVPVVSAAYREGEVR
ncbi:DUF6777 domain-containing protein [Rhodococcoides fascians]|uniref:DUF6777 domain-containing protein n=1 Tax=Rhodococcoides fascians TaxID=1828 RepID=UPI0018AFD72D|nr:DUF6777 domain-containing protein [Rhodococcus fascians]